MTKKIRWGILGCGSNAYRFAQDMAYAKKCQLLAAGSRSLRKAKAFAHKLNVDRAYGSYEQLVADKDVDVIYVATPHPFHMDTSLLSIKAGKSVLCEKPITINAKQARRMKTAAAKQSVFLMEGMWTRFFPAIIQVRKWLKDRRIGQVLAIKADFGRHFKVGPQHRIHNSELGGGVLLDLGSYVVSFASMTLGKQPEKIVSAVHMGETSVDDQASLLFQYSEGAIVSLSCSSRVHMEPHAYIYGTKGMIVIPPNFHRPSHIILKLEGKKEKTLEFPHPGWGFSFEADHVADCILKGKGQAISCP